MSCSRVSVTPQEFTLLAQALEGSTEFPWAPMACLWFIGLHVAVQLTQHHLLRRPDFKESLFFFFSKLNYRFNVFLIKIPKGDFYETPQIDHSIYMER